MEDQREHRLKALLRRLAAIGDSDKVQSDHPTKLFLSIRNDCRALQVFHREKVLSGQGRSKEELMEVDRYLISSEENLSSLRFESSDAPTQLKMALHLVAMKDRALHSLCSDLLKDLGVDYIEQAKDSDNHLSDLCSGELAQLFTLFRTFKTIGRMLKRIEITRADVRDSMEAMTRHHMISKLQSELHDKNEELEMYKAKFAVIDKDKGRDVAVIALLDSVAALQLEVTKLKAEMSATTTAHRSTAQREAELRDELVLCRTEVSRGKDKVAAEVKQLRTALDKEHIAAVADRDVVNSTKTQLSLWQSRLAFAEKQLESSKLEIKSEKAENRRLRSRHSMEDHILSSLEEDKSKWGRIANVAIAARSNALTLLELEKRKVEDERKKNDELEALFVMTRLAHEERMEGHLKAINALKEVAAQREFQMEQLTAQVSELVDRTSDMALHIQAMELHPNVTPISSSGKANSEAPYTTWKLEKEGYRKCFLLQPEDELL